MVYKKREKEVSIRMALRVWLPLNGSLENKGISDVTVTNNGATVDNNGKIGKCYKVDGSHYINISSSPWMSMKSANNFSLFLWVKGAVATWLIAAGGWELQLRPTFIKISLSGNGQYPAQYNDTFNENTWYHLGFTWNGDIGVLKLYLNGNEKASSTVPSSVDFDVRSTLKLSYGGPYYINDVRIYDHCLSAKEVKEISQGLVLHYKLDNPYSSNNLIENGYGENGTTNWTNSNRSTTEIPSGHPEIKASFYNGNMTNEYIPIASSHSYTISGYIKSSGATSGTAYPSIYPYDIDKKFIAHQNSRIGFNLATATTLTQPLKPGDTVIYVADLSKWDSNSGHYYNFCAIFGYKDSTGYIYPDFEYTQDLGKFGSGTNEKNNLDKQNNKITLTSAYNGSFHPAGTAVCASKEGSTYYYPFGGIALSSISDWVFKTATFIPQNNDRLRWSRYWKWSTYNNCYIAGNKLIDNTFISNIIKDSSGYENDGIITGTLTTESNSDRYKISTYFNGSSYTDTGSGTFNWYDFSQCTLSAWIKSTASVSSWSGSIGIQHNQNAGHKGFTITDYANNFRVVTVNGSYTTIDSGKPLTVGEWHHCAAVLNGTNLKMYYDGVMVKESTISWGSAAIATDMRFAIGIDFPGSDEKFIGNYSDIRMYATALSAEDILDLYHISASVDNLGGVHGFELEDKKQNILFPTCHALTTKDWNASILLKNYTQPNCQVTLTDDGLRIYRPANYNPTNNGKTMWGGMRLANTSDGGKHVYNNNDNPIGLQKGHTYIIIFKVKGKSSNATSNYGWTNNMGWGGGGLSPSPSNIEYDLIPANFNGEKICWYKWTINDDIVKTCTTSYSYATQGNQYMSYADFAFGWGYQDTGALGSDVYITNLRLYDITNLDMSNIQKNGIINFTQLDELTQTDKASITFYKELQATGFIEK